MKYTYKERVILAKKLKVFLAIFFAATIFFTGKVILDKTFAADNGLGTATITFNSGTDGQFEDGTTTNTVTYNLTKKVTRYSHTSNILDNGTQNSNYSNNMNTNDVVTISGSPKLHVKITYGTEASYDYVCVWEGNHSDYRAEANYSTSISGKLSGGEHTGSSNTKEYDITGDSVTFGFKSDYTGYGEDGYGYYAVITGEDPNDPDGELILGSIVSGEYKEPIANNEYYVFDNWDPDLSTITENATLNATYMDNTLVSGTYDGVDWLITKNYILFLGSSNEEQTFIYRATRSYNSYPWNTYCSQITKVRFKGIVNGNGSVQDMFSSFRALTDFDATNFNTTNVTTMYKMFNNCDALKSLDITSFNTSNVANMSYMFAECDELLNLNLSGLNANKVKDLSYMFYNCKKLANLDMTNFTTQDVVTMRRMFYYCNEVVSLDLSGFNTSKVTNMEETFYRLYKLKNLDISNFSTELVETMANMFYGCYLIKELDLSNFDTSNVTNMSYMFFACNELETLNLSSFITTNSTPMIGMFTNTYRLSTLVLGSDFVFNANTHLGGSWTKDNNVTIYTGAELEVSYDGSTMAGTYVTPTTAYAILYENGTMVFQADSTPDSSMENVEATYIGFETTDYNFANEIPWNYDREKVLKIVFENEITPISLADWFSGMTNLVKIENIEYLNTSNVTKMNWCFQGCRNLERLDLSNFNTTNVTTMQYMFYGCSSLKTLDLSSFDTSNVTNMSHMFSDCLNLKKVVLNSFDTTNVTDISWMFEECESLEKIDISSFETPNLINIDTIFRGCRKVKEIIGISDIDTSQTTGFSELFFGCKQLKYLDLTSWDTSNVINMYRTFDDCDSLTILDLSNFDTSNVTNMTETFRSCYNLAILDISSFNTVKVAASSRNSTDMFSGTLPFVLKLGINWKLNGTGGFDTNNYYRYKKDGDTETLYNRNQLTSGFDGATMAGVYRRSDITYAAMLYDSGELVFQNGVEPDSSKGNIIGAYTGIDSTIYNSANEVPWNDYATTITKVTFKDKIAPLSTAYWFYGMTNLNKFNNISNLNTMFTTSTKSMFENCTKLISFNMNNIEANSLTDMNSMFKGCTNLQSLNMSKFKAENLTDVTDIFTGTSLKTLNLGEQTEFNVLPALTGIWRKDGDTITTYTGNQVFSGSAGIYREQSNSVYAIIYDNGEMVFQAGNTPDPTKGTVLGSYTDFENLVIERTSDIPWIGNRNEVTKIIFSTTIVPTDTSAWFYGMKNLVEIENIELLNTENVENMVSMFSHCSSLTALDLSNFDTSNVEGMSAMFYNCKSLTTLDLSSFNTSNLKYISQMFSWCENLVNLDLSNFDTSKVDDMYELFYCDKKLVNLDLSGWDTSNVTSMLDMFSLCESLQALDLSSFDTSNVLDMMSMFQSCESLTSLDVSNFDTSNVTRMLQMFSNCNNLINLDISNFNTSNVTNMSKMFDNCESLTYLDVSNFDTSKVTDMSYMFSSCWELINLDVSNFDTHNVTNMQSMFRLCNLLTSLDVSNFDTSNVTNMAFMFEYCRKITNLNLSNFNTSNVTNMLQMFNSCTTLTELDVSNFDTSNVTEMRSMFSYCESITDLDLSSFDTSSVTTMTNMFKNTTQLDTLKLGTNWNFLTDNGLTKSWKRDGDTTIYTADELTNSYDGSTMSGTYRALVQLTIIEQVRGRIANVNKPFTFSINVLKDGNGINGNQSYSGTNSGNLNFTNGNATFTLKHNETIVIALNAGVEYTITQDSDGYTLSKTNDTGTLNGDATATFTDTLNGTPPTGILIKLIPYIIIVIISTIGIIWVYKFRRI